jgi:hypothetical protein
VCNRKHGQYPRRPSDAARRCHHPALWCAALPNGTASHHAHGQPDITGLQCFRERHYVGFHVGAVVGDGVVHRFNDNKYVTMSQHLLTYFPVDTLLSLTPAAYSSAQTSQNKSLDALIRLRFPMPVAPHWADGLENPVMHGAEVMRRQAYGFFMPSRLWWVVYWEAVKQPAGSMPRFLNPVHHPPP